MITMNHNGVSMRVTAYCEWGLGILIYQEWDHPQRGKWVESIKLTPEQAKLLIIEMQKAIDEHERIDRSYEEDMREEDARQGNST